MNPVSRQNTAPATVKIAVCLVIAGAISDISRFVFALIRGGHVSSLRSTTMVVFIVVTAVKLLLAVAFMRGMNWTRWFYLALTALSLFTLPTALRDAFIRSTFSGVYVSSQDLLQYSTAILLFVRSSSCWFRRPPNTSLEPTPTAP
jgi:hypothetical protein